MEHPIVVCGLGSMGNRVLECLHAAGLPVVVIDNTCQTDDPRLPDLALVRGDFRHRQVLEQAGVSTARAVFILTRDDLLNISTALLIRSFNPHARIVLRLFNHELLSRLEHAIDNVFALSTSLLAAPLLALTALTGHGLAAFRLDHSEERQVIELPVAEGSRWCGQTIEQVLDDPTVVVLGHMPIMGAERCLFDVDRSHRLQNGDRLVLCGSQAALAALVADGAPEAEPALQWASWHRRMTRVVHRTLQEMEPAVLICTAVLLLVVACSMLILHLGMERYSLADALFRTISIMATGARLPEEELTGHPGMKVFVSVLRILGMALLAAFTAILTNYLLRARLGGALEMRRIPDGGHVIVCGLGATGYRTVEELSRFGLQVVVIEQDANNRLIRRARKVGAAVLIGDATMPEVLREAHATSAHAVIASTDNDLVNLAVSLLVREWKPHQRVVVVLEDVQLARMLREAARVQLAVSLPGLAAPAFLAALYGNRVMSVFQMRSRLYAVIDLLVGEQDALAGCALEKVARDFCLCPLAAYDVEGKPMRALHSLPLKAGDRLVASVALPDLEKLLLARQTTTRMG